MADIPSDHLGHALLHRVALGGHHQVSAHRGDLLHGGALARLPQKRNLIRRGLREGKGYMGKKARRVHSTQAFLDTLRV